MTSHSNSSARHIFETLREVCASREPLGVAEVSRRLGLSVSTAQRALLTLTQSGYLKRHPYAAKYRMGFTAERLVNALLERFTIRPASVAFLRQLAASSRRTASLYVRIGWYSIKLVGIDPGNSPALLTRRLGEAALLDSDAASLAILAFLSSEEIACFADFKVTDGALAEHLRTIRQSGYAYQRAATPVGHAPSGGAELPLESLSFPVIGVDELAVASVAIEGAPDAQPLAQHPLRDEWEEIVGELTKFVQTKRGLCVNPFAHLDPQTVHFGPRELDQIADDDSDFRDGVADDGDPELTVGASLVAAEEAEISAPFGKLSTGLLAGKVAVITAGGSEIGRAAVLRFLEEGAAVVFADCDNRTGAKTLSLAHGLGFADARFLPVDVSCQEDIRAMIEMAKREFGRIDCVFNSAAGGGVHAPLLETTVEEFKRVLDINLLGAFLCLQHGGRALKEQGDGGTLISTSSVVALDRMSSAQYSVAKTAIIKLTLEFARELGPFNIRVNFIASGAILPLMFKGEPQYRKPLLERASPRKTVGPLEDVANAAVFLASDLSRFVNGTNLVVDGTMLAEETFEPQLREVPRSAAPQ